jgi:transcriptional regulator with XRE-family HTH domain
MTISNKVGEKIRQLRQEKGLKQEEFAELAGIDYSYLNQLENGKRNPTVEMLDKIAKALDTTPENLLSF